MPPTVKVIGTFTAGEALEPYRRVKFDGSNADTIVYADATDGDSWIGATLPNPEGDAYASGDRVSVALRGENYGLEITASAAVTANATIYPEDDGKVSDDAGTVTIGTAIYGTASTSGDRIVMLPNKGAGSAPDETSIAPADATTLAGVPVALRVAGLAAAATTHEIKKPARKLRLLHATAVLRDQTTATDVLLKVGATTVAAALSLDTADEHKMFNLNDAVTEIAAASTIYASVATAATAPGVDIYILAMPVP